MNVLFPESSESFLSFARLTIRLDITFFDLVQFYYQRFLKGSPEFPSVFWKAKIKRAYLFQ